MKTMVQVGMREMPESEIVPLVRIGEWIFGASPHPDLQERRWIGWAKIARDGSEWERDHGMLGSFEAIVRRYAASALGQAGSREEVVYIHPEAAKARDEIKREAEEAAREAEAKRKAETEAFEARQKKIAEIEYAGHLLRGKKATIKLAVASGNKAPEVKATVFEGLLAVHQALLGRSWVVTHVPSGRAVVSGCCSQSRARGIAAVMLKVGIPADVAEAAKNHALRDKVMEIVRENLE
jgi:hypothetical protein